MLKGEIGHKTIQKPSAGYSFETGTITTFEIRWFSTIKFYNMTDTYTISFCGLWILGIESILPVLTKFFEKLPCRTSSLAMMGLKLTMVPSGRSLLGSHVLPKFHLLSVVGIFVQSFPYFTFNFVTILIRLIEMEKLECIHNGCRSPWPYTGLWFVLFAVYCVDCQVLHSSWLNETAINS